MKPSPRVQRELRIIHPGLYAEWGKKRQRWLIKKPDRDSSHISIIMIVENPDHSYRPIDERTYSQLRKGRWLALKRLNELLYELEEEEQKPEEEQNKQWEAMASSVSSTLRRTWY